MLIIIWHGFILLQVNIIILGMVMRTFMQLKMNQDKSEVNKIK